MPRLRVRFFVGALVLLWSLAVLTQPPALAQDATPAGEARPEGAAFELVTFAGVMLSSLADFLVALIQLEPGATLPTDPTDPSLGILLVEFGTFTVRVSQRVSVRRGAGLGAALATAEATGAFGAFTESVAPDEAVTLEAGDAAFVPANVGGEIRNDGQEPAVGLVFFIIPFEEMTGQAGPAP